MATSALQRTMLVVVKAEYVGSMEQGLPDDAKESPRTDKTVPTSLTLRMRRTLNRGQAAPWAFFRVVLIHRKCKESCNYLLHVSVDYFGESTSVQGSPFKMTVGERRLKKSAKEEEMGEKHRRMLRVQDTKRMRAIWLSK